MRHILKFTTLLFVFVPVSVDAVDTKLRRHLQSSVNEDVQNAIADIWVLMENDEDLAPKFVRLGFHDCIGGCDGCVNMLDLDNAGLDIPIEALNPIVNTYESESEAGLSRADIWALAAITGSNFAHPDSDSFFVLNEIGRENCAENDPTGGPSRDFPSPNLETDDLLDFFADTFDFDEQETCAIMGAHTIGRVHQENSGFIGNRGWSNNRRRLDNDYYRQIVGGGDTLDDFFDAPNWDQDEIVNGGDIPTRFQWERRGGRGNGSGDGPPPPNGFNDGPPPPDNGFNGFNGGDGPQGGPGDRGPGGQGGGEGGVNGFNDGPQGGPGGRGGGGPGGQGGRGGGGRRGGPGRNLFILTNNIFHRNCDDNADENDVNILNPFARGGGSGNSGGSFDGDGGQGGGGDPIIMLNTDIGLVRNLIGEIDEDGEVNCEFRGNDACPAASTLPQMAVYRNNNSIWLDDFKDALEKMLVQGCDDCQPL